MILLRLRLRLGRPLSLSPALLLSLPPLVVRILTSSTVPLLSSEWGAREDLGFLVALVAWGVWVFVVPPLAIPLPQVSLLTPPTERFGPTTFRVQFRRRFLLSSSTIMGLLHLLGDIPTSLHLWRIPLLRQFFRCVLCPVGISPLRQLRTSLCPVGLLPPQMRLLPSWSLRFLPPPSLLLRRLRPVLLPPKLLLPLSTSPLSRQSLSSCLKSRMSRVTWICKIKSRTTFGLRRTPPNAWMPFSSLILPMRRPVVIERVSSELLSRMGGFAFFSRTLVRVFMARVLK